MIVTTESSDAGAARGGPIRLAQEAPLSLGPLQIEPNRRRVLAGAREELLQPRVMQALVALAQADGEILSRDDLLERCWHGVVVGDDSIDRVIGRLRRLFEQLAPDEVRLETIPRVGYRLVPSEPAETDDATDASATPVLAVLAFDNLSGDPDFRYFSDGISEEILLTVAKTTGLQVIGRASSFQLRGAAKSARSVAETLDATHVLDGAVRRSGGRVRVSAELVDCATQTRLWSDRFDRPLADVFALQDEIAAAVADALKAQFAPSLGVRQIDPSAYDLYLRARDRNPEDMGFDPAPLEAAVARAPEFGQAWALLAFSRAVHLNWIASPDDVHAMRAAALRAAETALELDPSAAHAFLAMEMSEPICGHYAQRMALVEKALAAAPNDPLVLIHTAGLYDTLGYQRIAYGFMARGYQLNPRHAAFYYPYLLEAIGLHVEARAALDRDIARWPDSLVLRAVAMRFAYEAGDWERYDRELALLPPEIAGHPLLMLLRTHAERYRHWSDETGQQLMGELRATLEATGTIPLGALALPAQHGLLDEVYELIDQASFDHLHAPHGRLTPGEISLNVLYTPSFGAMRRDVRFVSLCARLGLADHWLTTNNWPDFMVETAPFYDLRAETARLIAGPPRRAAG